jgi:tRNA pseudouridine55 synthase
MPPKSEPGASRRKSHPVHGWLVLDKAIGLTSTQALGKVKYLLGAAKAGHAGTLDPLAEGVLPLAFGEATKTVPFLVDANKVYRFTVRWGAETTTDDAEGEVVRCSDLRADRAQILGALPEFVGSIRQTPPQFSAVKFHGERAYDLAREGVEMALESRIVDVHRIELLQDDGMDVSHFHMVCGKGTYVRAFARDLGRKLGVFGHISALRRLAVGPFDETRAVTLEMIAECANRGAAQSLLLPISTALDDIPALAVTDQEASLLRQGQAILARGRVLQTNPPESDRDQSAPRAVYCRSRAGDPVALAHFTLGELRPQRVFNFNTGK